MGTNPNINNRYPKTIELDESLGSPGPSFMRVRPGAQPQEYLSNVVDRAHTFRRLPVAWLGLID